MADSKDVLAREVSVKASVEGSGISLKAKSRALAAFDRLLGALTDWPASFLEAKANATRARSAVEMRLIGVEGDAAEEKLLQSNTAGDRIIKQFIDVQSERQGNVDAIAAGTTAELRLLPAPDQGSNEGDGDNEQESLDDDWINAFRRYAEDASSVRLRRLWSKVLAGEIISPGSFSRSTLRVLSEIDTQTAIDFRDVMQFCLADKIYHPPSWNRGEEYLRSLRLASAGLFNSAAGVTTLTPNFDNNGLLIISGFKLGAVLHGPAGAQVSFGIMNLTQVGLELQKLTNAVDETRSIQSLIAVAEGTPTTSISFGRVEEKPGGLITVYAAVEIWRRPGS